MKSSTIQSVSTLSRVPVKTLNKLVELATLSITDDLYDAIQKSEELVEIDIGIGTLSILTRDGNIKFRFIPSAKLEENIINTLKGQNELQEVTEQSLVDKINQLYKDLL